MKPQDLVNHCIECYTSFNSKKTTIDSHVELYLTKIDCADEGDAVFIKQVVYGCIRFKKLNKVVLTALYFKHGSEVSREDYHLYMIFSYLTLIRLEDMGVPIFRKFVMAQDSLKMFVWLTFIFNAQTLNKWMKEEWCRIYDEQYVEDELIARLLRNLPEVSEIIERLREVASTRDEDDVGEGDEKAKLPTTKVVPFALSKGKPRAVPEPIAIPLENPYKKPIPKSLYEAAGDGTILKVEEARKKAKEESQHKHAASKAPAFETAKLPDKKVVRAGKFREALAEEAEKRLEVETRYVTPNIVDPAKALTAAERAAVRLNAAAVLREDALLRKRQEEEARLIKQYESELRDDSEFYEWQAKMRERDELKRLEEVEQRRIQMILTDEAAKEARIQAERDNHRFATEMRREAGAIRELTKAEQEQVLLEKQKMVDDVKESEKNVRPAVEAVLEEKKMMGMELRAEVKRLAEEEAERRAIEEAERMEVVRQIRALESVPVDRTAHFDATAVSDGSKHVLEAMSLAELRERLVMVQNLQKQKEEEKRAEIIGDKQAREADLVDRMQTIQKVREIREREAKDMRRKKLKKEEEEKALRVKIRNEAQLVLQKEIEHRRRARLDEDAKLKKEMQEIEIKKQFLAAGAAQVEEKKFRSLEDGAERKLAERVSRERQEHEAYVLSMQREENQRTRVLKQKQQAKKDFREDYRTRYLEGVASMADALGTAHAEKRELVAATRDFESTIRDKAITADPNKHLVNVKSMSSSRRYRDKRLAHESAAATGRKTVTVREEVAAKAGSHAEMGRTFRGLPYLTGAVGEAPSSRPGT